jgi:ornithine carbamoyltransferase
MDKDFICIKDLSVKEIEQIFSLAARVKKNRRLYSCKLKGKTLALIFQKPSNRTRVSFEVAIYELGGNAIYLGSDDIKLGVRETTADVARTLSRYLSGIIARTFSHDDLLELAKYSTVPVINGLTDLHHPCQALADIFTIKEIKNNLKGVNLAFVGDGNNVLNSLLYGCSKMGINLFIATPKKYRPDEKILEDALRIAKESGSLISLTDNPEEAARNCDFLYTDVWVSMGQEDERDTRLRDFQGYQINKNLLAKAGNKPYILHCLPAHRGEEITDEIIDGEASVVFEQAENRLHVQKAVLIKLIGRN